MGGYNSFKVDREGTTRAIVPWDGSRPHSITSAPTWSSLFVVLSTLGIRCRRYLRGDGRWAARLCVQHDPCASTIEVQRRSVCKPLGDVSEQQIAVMSVVIARSTDDDNIVQSKTRPRIRKINLRDTGSRHPWWAGIPEQLAARRSDWRVGRCGGWKRGSAGAGRSAATLERTASS